MTQQNLGTILIDKELEKIVFYKSKTPINQDYSTVKYLEENTFQEI